MTIAPGSGRERARARSAVLTIAVLAMAGVVVSIMQAVVIPLIPDLPSLLHVPPEDASWVITATLLAGVVATPSLSRLADMYGKRRMMLVSLVALLLGSTIGAITTALIPVVFARSLQGFALALMPISVSIMRDELPPERLRSGVAMVGATLGIGVAIGLPLSGLIYSHFGWHAIFWVSALAAVCMIAAVVIVIPESPQRSGGTFDLIGALLLAGCLAGLLLAITKGGHWGWTSPPTLASLGAAATLAMLWVPWELHRQDPVVDLGTTRQRAVMLTNVSGFFLGFALMANLLSTTQLLQLPLTTGYGFGQTVLQASLSLLPVAIAMTVFARVASWWMGRFGARVTLATGTLVIAVGYAARILLMSTEWQVIVGAVVVAAGMILGLSSMPVLLMSSVPASETAAANGLNSVMRNIGTSSASALVASILTTVVMRVGDESFPRQSAFQYVYAIAALGGLFACVAALAVPRRRSDSAEVAAFAEEPPSTPID